MTHSPLQLEAIEAYDKTDGPSYRQDLESGGNPEEVLSDDTLALFVFREIGDAGDDLEEAARMMETAADQLYALSTFLQNKLQ